MGGHHERRGAGRDQLIPPEHETGIKLIHWLSPIPKKDQKYKLHLAHKGDSVKVIKTETVTRSRTNEHGTIEVIETRIITPNQLEAAQRCIEHLLPSLYQHPTLEMAVTRAMPNVGKIRRMLVEEKSK